MNQNRMQKLRSEINKIDKELLYKLQQRFEVAHKIGVEKKTNNQSVDDKVREQELDKLHKQYAEELGLDKDFVKKLFEVVIKESKRLQL